MGPQSHDNSGLGGGQFGVGPGGDDGQDAARGGQVLGREVAEEPGGDVLQGGADLVVTGLAGLAQADAGLVAGQDQAGGGQLGDRGLYLVRVKSRRKKA